MTKLVPAREAAALAFARDRVAYYRDNTIPGLNARMLDKDDNRHFARQHVKAYALAHPLYMMEIADAARAGWRLADEALRELIVEAIDRGERLPTYLAAYNMEVARGGLRKLPGREKADTFLRDIVMVTIVNELVERFNLPPTGRHCSACSIVANAMGEARINIAYKGIETIWNRWGGVLSAAQ